MTRSPLAQQRGMALLIVLFIVALVSVLATEMGSRLQLQVQRASNIKDNNQAYWYSIGAEAYAMIAIKNLYELDDGNIHLDQPWAQPLVYPIENGQITATITDSQACFNINALAQPPSSSNTGDRNTTPAMDAFSALVRKITNGDTYTADIVRDSLVDYLDDNTSARPYGAEDDTYLGLRYPHLSANTLLTEVSELRLVNGVNVEWFADLLQYVCVLPQNQNLVININTLTEDDDILLSAVTGLSVSDAQSLIESRPERGYETAADFFDEPEMAGIILSDTQRTWFNTTTEYFTLTTITQYNETQFTLTSLMHVTNQENVSVIQRTFGRR
ncbi:MAG: type II secretion system minor pseudopilin GspK [Glaciecola sp.]|nr:type II secretion system minor pseudopilin GspK [Glaciecola sp.]